MRVIDPDQPWVSRGGVKLAFALDSFAIDVAGRLGLDIGASTGGFTDVLLQRGARRVIALDVGHNQLHWKLAQRSAVTVIEGNNARHLTRGDLPDCGAADHARHHRRLVHLVASHLSGVPALLAADADVVALVKPQFEAGRDDVGRGGLVTDPAVHARVLDEVSAAAAKVGLDAHRPDRVTHHRRGRQPRVPAAPPRSSRQRSSDWRAPDAGRVARHTLVDARETLAALDNWLRSHNVDVVWTTEAATLMPPANRAIVDREDMPATRTSSSCSVATVRCSPMAKIIAESGRDVPILGGQLRVARIPHRDHAARVVQRARSRHRRAARRTTR